MFKHRGDFDAWRQNRERLIGTNTRNIKRSMHEARTLKFLFSNFLFFGNPGVGVYFPAGDHRLPDIKKNREARFTEIAEVTGMEVATAYPSPGYREGIT